MCGPESARVGVADSILKDLRRAKPSDFISDSGIARFVIAAIIACFVAIHVEVLFPRQVGVGKPVPNLGGRDLTVAKNDSRGRAFVAVTLNVGRRRGTQRAGLAVRSGCVQNVGVADVAADAARIVGLDAARDRKGASQDRRGTAGRVRVNFVRTTGRAAHEPHRRGDARGHGIGTRRTAFAASELVKRVLLHERQDAVVPAAGLRGAETFFRVTDAAVMPASGRKVLGRGHMVLAGKSDLFQIVGALHAARGLTSLLNGRQQKPDQHSNDGDDDQQFDQREPETTVNFFRRA